MLYGWCLIFRHCETHLVSGKNAEFFMLDQVVNVDITGINRLMLSSISVKFVYFKL